MDEMNRYIESKNRSDARMRATGLDDEDYLDAPAVTDAEVDAAEARLGVKLPPSYRRLVTSTSSYQWDSVAWIIDDEDHYKCIFAQDGLHPLLIAFSPVGDGDRYCFDARHPGPDGEYPIVLTDHESDGEEITEFRSVAPDLVTFLKSQLGGDRQPTEPG